MLQRRPIDIAQDRQLLLDLHCRINYASETPYARRVPYEEYRLKWLSTFQPETFLADLAQSIQDDRTVAEIWEVEGGVAGYLWVTFTDLADYELTIAEVMDLAVLPEYQGQGIGQQLLRYAESQARRQGATLLRSDTGVENRASQRLHERLEFHPYRICYEKVLRYEKAGPPISLERIERALAGAQEILRQHGYDYAISAKDLRSYAEADTFYPSAISWDDILDNPLIVAHETVEVAELKRKGLEINKDVIVQNLEEIYEAHLAAGEVEMALAQALGNLDHIQSRLKAARDWLEDPLVPSALRDRYNALYAHMKDLLEEREEKHHA